MSERRELSRKEFILTLMVGIIVILTLINLYYLVPQLRNTHSVNAANQKILDDTVEVIRKELAEATRVELQETDGQTKFDHVVSFYQGSVYLDGKTIYNRTQHENKRLRMIINGSGRKLSISAQLVDETNRTLYTQNYEIRVNQLELTHFEIEGKNNEDLINPSISYTTDINIGDK